MSSSPPNRMNMSRFLLPILVLGSAVPAQSTAASEIRSLAEHAFELFQPVGLAVAAVEGDDVLIEVGFGERVRGAGEPIEPTTQFNIASCTKAFTAASIAKLVAAGRLRWDDRVIDHVPEFRLADPWITNHLTVRDLLCHRSGLETFAGDLLWYGTTYDDAAVMARMRRLPITQRFREEFGYQNLMYLVAGQLVERVSGRDWSEFVRQDLFEPLGMAGTSIGAEGLPDDAIPAQPHIDGARIEVVEFDACKPAGAIWSSVHDLTRWMRMLLAGGSWDGSQLLDQATIHEMWKPHTSLASGRTPAAIEDFSSYGLGWFLYVDEGRKLVEHDGGMPGYTSKVSLLPAERFGLVILNNGMNGVVNIALRRAILAQRGGGDGRAILERFAQLAKARSARADDAERRRIAARLPDTAPTHALEAYTGRFEDAVLGAAEVTLEGDALRLVIVPAARTFHGDLTHWHLDVFRVDFPDRFLPFALVRFTLDVEGKVDGFRIDCPIDDFDFGALDFRRAGGIGR